MAVTMRSLAREADELKDTVASVRDVSMQQSS